VPSPTQRELTPAEVALAVRAAFGPEASIHTSRPLPGGGFGTVWRVDLDDGRQTVLKVGPAVDAKLLSYESGMLNAEADYLRLVAEHAPQIPTPRLMHQSEDSLFMSLMPGVALPALPPHADTSTARFECGAAIARLHAVTGDSFGYTGRRPHGDTWADAFTAMVEALLDDAAQWEVALPVEPARIRSAVSDCTGLLNTVTTAALLHFDLWDGNVLATDDGHLGGLVDGERYLFGDPLVDFTSPALYRDIFEEPDHPFLSGYRSIRPIAIDGGSRRRAWLYQLYLYLLMTVEFPSRGMTMASHGDRWVRLSGLLDDLLTKLES
jgi:fructosamine-3-kinase